MNWIVRNNFGVKRKSNGVINIRDFLRKQNNQEEKKNIIEKGFLKQNFTLDQGNFNEGNNKKYQNEFYQIYSNDKSLNQLQESEKIISNIININFVETSCNEYIE